MQEIDIKFFKNNKICSGKAVYFNNTTDVDAEVHRYFSWKNDCNEDEKYGCRKQNAPELVSEGMACSLLGYLRTNNTSYSNLSYSSFDAIKIDPETQEGTTIQIKAITTSKNSKVGPTSFGPNSKSDKLLFSVIDMDNDQIKYYDFPIEEVDSLKVNKNETVLDQKNAGRRPRLNMLEEINKRKLQPFYIFDLNTKEKINA